MSDFQPSNFSSYNHQDQSPLFSVLPPEIRNDIYAYALTAYEDFARPHSKNTYWWRPGDRAALRTATELLRTCRRVYNEAWLLQFALAEHCFYLTHAERAPGGRDWPRGFEECNRLIYETYGKHRQTTTTTIPRPGCGFGLGRIRVFAQLWQLEPGKELQRILDVPYFHARHVAVTIRYSDFWFWEDNAPLFVRADWVNMIRLPDSVTRFSVDFEMIERRKEEVDMIARAAAEMWTFGRRDGAVLAASVDEEHISVSKWTGSSVLGYKRWVRDEVRPGQLDYHVVTVTWKLRQGATTTTATSSGSGICPHRSHCPGLEGPRASVPPPPFTEVASINMFQMREAKVSLDTPALDALLAVANYYEDWDDDSED
ncbi:hypothetical protein PHISP_05837 [Aspergillus sp. HF37]|nr:hypothetical protein PHISP_05837 [Aspergillus sp. HF37]